MQLQFGKTFIHFCNLFQSHIYFKQLQQLCGLLSAFSLAVFCLPVLKDSPQLMSALPRFTSAVAVCLYALAHLYQIHCCGLFLSV